MNCYQKTTNDETTKGRLKCLNDSFVFQEKKKYVPTDVQRSMFQSYLKKNKKPFLVIMFSVHIELYIFA